MQSQNDGLNLFEQEHKRDIKSAFAITGLIALGAAAAIGVGFVLGGRGGDGRESGVAGAAATATRTLPVSPTAASGAGPQGTVQGAQAAGQPGSSGNTGGGQTGANGGGNAGGGGGGGEPPSNGGDTSGYEGEPDAPVTTATAVPPTATNTAIPPTSTATNTPVPPTNTPTATATATATPGFEICIPCLDPGIIIHLDFVAPSFVSTYRADCPTGTWVTFDVDETANLWVTYTVLGLPFESGHVNDTHFEESITGPFFYAHDVVFHATDVWGNASTYGPGLGFCF